MRRRWRLKPHRVSRQRAAAGDSRGGWRVPPEGDTALWVCPTAGAVGATAPLESEPPSPGPRPRRALESKTGLRKNPKKWSCAG